MRLTPAAGASGVFDLTLGQPGLVPEISPGVAPRTVYAAFRAKREILSVICERWLERAGARERA